MLQSFFGPGKIHYSHGNQTSAVQPENVFVLLTANILVSVRCALETGLLWMSPTTCLGGLLPSIGTGYFSKGPNTWTECPW